jgi:hypothetical protein
VSCNQNGWVSVTGILESVNWDGTVGSGIKISCYMSEQNANQLRYSQTSTLTTTKINAIGWWIAGFDKVSRCWFEQNYPASPTTLTGLIGPSDCPDLQIDGKGVQAPGIDGALFKVQLTLAPSANKAAMIMVASSARARGMKNWGLKVGTWASAVA